MSISFVFCFVIIVYAFYKIFLRIVYSLYVFITFHVDAFLQSNIYALYDQTIYFILYIFGDKYFVVCTCIMHNHGERMSKKILCQ